MSRLPLPITALSSNSNTLVIASGSTIHTCKPSNGHLASCTAGPSKPSPTPALIRNLAISPDGAYAASLADDKSLHVYSLLPAPTLSSTRAVLKRGSDLSWSPAGEIILSDKIGDVYLYPREPLPPPTEEEKKHKQSQLTSDPTLNPDASLLAGHVSIVTSHVLTPDGRHLITADRDEHIRVSHFPKSYIISHYLFGSDGFVSALHIPPSQPSLLLSAGGESVLRIWNWKEGKQVAQVDIWDAMLPHRRVRSHMRKTRKRIQVDSPAGVEGNGESAFHRAPEGFQLPSGEGICIKKIQSIDVGGHTVVLLFSEGCAAIHSFLLPEDVSSPITLSTLPLSHPILDFAPIPGSPELVLVSHDTAWGSLKANAEGMTQGHQRLNKSLSEEEAAEMSKSLAVVKISPDGALGLIPDHPLLATLYYTLHDSQNLYPAETIAALQIYPLLPILPRWLGQEEDDDLAGPAATPSGQASETASIASERQSERKTYTRAELEGMNVKMLGRLRAKGVDIGDLIYKKEKRYKADKAEKEQTMAAAKAEKAARKVDT